MIKAILLFVLFSVYSAHAVDPFSHIKITSNKATCQKSKDSCHTFVFNYIDNVAVLLADSSHITSDMLEIILDSKNVKALDKANNHKSKNLSHIKKITFKKNVSFSNQNRNAQADSAIINILENTCLLEGNVKIKQLKAKQNDIPLEVQSSQALINMKTSDVTLLGSNRDPVSTVIELGKNILSPDKKQHNKPTTSQ